MEIAFAFLSHELLLHLSVYEKVSQQLTLVTTEWKFVALNLTKLGTESILIIHPKLLSALSPADTNESFYNSFHSTLGHSRVEVTRWNFG